MNRPRRPPRQSRSGLVVGIASDGSDLIVSQAPGYLLRVDPERFDLARFERLVAEARRPVSRGTR